MLYKIVLIGLLNIAIANSYIINGYPCEEKPGLTNPFGRNVPNCLVLLNKIFSSSSQESKESEEANAHQDRRFNEIDWRPTSYETARAEAKANAKFGVALDSIKSDVYAIRESLSYMELLTQKVFEKVEHRHEQTMEKLGLFGRQIEHLTKELADMRAEVMTPSSTTPTATVDSDSASKEDNSEDDSEMADATEEEADRFWREMLDTLLAQRLGDSTVQRPTGAVDAVDELENSGDGNDVHDIMSALSAYTFYDTDNNDADVDDLQFNNNDFGQMPDMPEATTQSELGSELSEEVSRELEHEPEMDYNYDDY